MVTIYILMLLSGDLSTAEATGIPIAAKGAVERQIRHLKQVTVEEPYYSFLSNARKIVTSDFDSGDLIPSYATDTRWHFPVTQGKVVYQVWRVCQDGDSYKTCGYTKWSETTHEFLKRREKLKPRYELAMLNINDVGQFWVVHQRLVAKAIIPVNNSAWKTLTGKYWKHTDGLEVGEKYNMRLAAKRIRDAAEEAIKRYGE